MSLIIFFEKLLKLIKVIAISRPNIWDLRKFSINSTEIAIGISKYCSEINTIIDVGANCGQFANAIKRVYPKSHLYSFEPIEKEYNKLCRSLSKTSNFKAFNIALGSEVGSTKFYLNSYSLSSSILNITSEHTSEKPSTMNSEIIEIGLSTLDYLVLNEQIVINGNTLLKIDVQGYEKEVLLGSLKVLERIHYVLIECSFVPLYREEALFGEINELLNEIGFTLKAPLSFWQTKELKIIQTDLLYERK